MFGGLTKTSSRIAIAAALGLTLGGFAFKATPAQAADLGGDCCADLEERVAELEATTVRKGNKKVSVTLSGWVVKSMNYWDDGDLDHFVVGDKDADLSSRFAITGSAQIAPGWSGGFNLTTVQDGDIFGIGSNQEADLVGGGIDIRTLYSYIYIKSDTLGALNWGTLSPASDNPAVLADISGTVIESNGVWFEGPGFFLRPKGGGNGDAGLSGLKWGDFLLCQGLGAGIGVDCWGAPQAAVRYDSPTWGGFRFEASYGENQAPSFALVPDNFTAEDQDFADIAVFYTADWNSIKLSAAASYTWIETAVVTGTEADLFQVGASVMHKPSGLGIYAMGQWEQSDGATLGSLGPSAYLYDTTTYPYINGIAGFSNVCGGSNCSEIEGFGWVPGGGPFVSFNNQDTDAWYVKPFWRKAWSPLGATVLYGEFGQYNDQFAAGQNLCFAGFGAGTSVGNFCAATTFLSGDLNPGSGSFVISNPLVLGGVFATGSETERFGLGVVQEIDSAAMHLWARWQHQELDVDLVGYQATNFDTGSCNEEDITGCQFSKSRVKQSFDDFDLFQVGGIIFF